jgi:2-methylisocitrate lyase-like PEP mutase family enzyme
MSMERYDLSLLRDEARQNIRSLYATTELPLNADFESG